MNEKTVFGCTVKDVIFEGHEDFQLVHEERVGGDHNSTTYFAVCKHLPTETLWCFEYDISYDDGFDDYSSYGFTEVEPYEVITTKYRVSEK